MNSEYVDFKIRGIQEIDSLLKKLPLKIQKKALNQAARSGAAIIRKEAKKNARRFPRRGQMHLYKEIKSAKSRKSKPWFPIWSVGCGKAFWGRFLEQGWIATGPRGKKKGSWKGWRKAKKLTGARHIPAKPWLRPAFKTKYREAIKVAAQKLGNAIENETRKLAR